MTLVQRLESILETNSNVIDIKDFIEICNREYHLTIKPATTLQNLWKLYRPNSKSNYFLRIYDKEPQIRHISEVQSASVNVNAGDTHQSQSKGTSQYGIFQIKLGSVDPKELNSVREARRISAGPKAESVAMQTTPITAKKTRLFPVMLGLPQLTKVNETQEYPLPEGQILLMYKNYVDKKFHIGNRSVDSFSGTQFHSMQTTIFKRYSYYTKRLFYDNPEIHTLVLVLNNNLLTQGFTRRDATQDQISILGYIDKTNCRYYPMKDSLRASFGRQNTEGVSDIFGDHSLPDVILSPIPQDQLNVYALLNQVGGRQTKPDPQIRIKSTYGIDPETGQILMQTSEHDEIMDRVLGSILGNFGSFQERKQKLQDALDVDIVANEYFNQQKLALSNPEGVADPQFSKSWIQKMFATY